MWSIAMLPFHGHEARRDVCTSKLWGDRSLPNKWAAEYSSMALLHVQYSSLLYIGSDIRGEGINPGRPPYVPINAT